MTVATTILDRTLVISAWDLERRTATAARLRGDHSGEWYHLERAHILSQPVTALHLRTHAAMLLYGIRHRDHREVLGQAARLLLAGPASLTGRYPAGNTGGARVSALRPMPVPDDLVAVLTPTTVAA